MTVCAVSHREQVPDFLNRTNLLFGPEVLKRLRQARVLIAGCGGVGGAVAVTLARLGVGHFVVADPGRFDPPDLNRQWAADQTTVGMNKAACYRDWLKAINPATNVESHEQGVTWQNVADLIEPVDLVVDCLDVQVDLALRGRLFALARSAGIHSITAPVLGFGALVVTAAPDGESMEPFLDLLGRVMRTGKLPGRFHEFYAPACIQAIEHHLCTGKVPSLSIGPVLAGALASTEAMLALLNQHGEFARQPLCLPDVLMMDALTMGYRTARIEDLLD